MRTFLLPAAILAAAVPVAAQADHFSSSPEGYEFTEGNSDSRDLIGTEPLLRYQQIDSTNTRSMTNRVKMAFRRDGQLFDDPEYGPRTVELEVVMAESDLGSISNVFANNYKANMAVVVSRKMISFPDWTLKPAGLPANHDLEISLDQPWSYTGTVASGNDFLWEVRVFSNTKAGQDYPFDLEYKVPNGQFGNPSPTISSASTLATGCTVPGESSAYSISPEILNYRTYFELESSVAHGPVNAAVAMFISGQNANLSVPTMCSTVNALPDAMVSFGPTDATGAATMNAIQFPHDASWIGLKLYFQGASLCSTCFPGQVDVALTRGREVTIPADPPYPALGRVWAMDPNAGVATFGPAPGGIVLFTNHP